MGLGRVLGHAMMGYGKGKALVAQSEMEAQAAEVENKRRIALENLRAQNDSTARRETADLNDRNDARSTERSLSTDLVKLDAQEEVTARTDNRRHAQDKEITNITSSLRRAETAEQLKLADKLDRAAKAGDVHAVEVDGATGEKVIVYRNGKRERTGIMATQRELTGSGGSSVGSSALDLARSGGGLGSPRPAPAASTAPTTKPNAQQTGGKTYTMADAQATAKQHGVSVEDVHKRMREAGYRLAGQ